MSWMEIKSFFTRFLLGGRYPRPRPAEQRGLEMAGRGDQALFPARLDVFDGGLDLRAHRPPRELALGQVFLRLCDGHGFDRPFLRCPEIQGDAFNAGQDDEKVDLDLPGDQAGHIVLVDDGLDSREEAAAINDDRDPSPACGDDDPAGADEVPYDPL